MKLYTRTGDSGETSLFDGSRVPKDNARVSAYGELDELNALLGWCRCTPGTPEILSHLQVIQSDLFVLGAELATPPDSRNLTRLVLLGEAEHRRLESWIDEAAGAVPPLRTFILPGGAELAARLHVARTCCRRAERTVVALSHLSSVRPDVIVYLNRLGDLLFAWARQANHDSGTADIPWTSQRQH